jgi:flagellin
MSRINSNVQSLIAQRVLARNNEGLSTSLERLSTGFRINRGADDPAGLIASENLRAEKTAINAAISNAERAEQVVNIAEGGLQEISSLLIQLEGLITSTANEAGLSDEEREANQQQVDSILQTIDRIAGSTSFQGSRLLNGNLDYNTTAVSADVQDFTVFGAKIADNQSLDVEVIVTNSAQVGGYFLSFGGASLDLGSATDTFVIEVAGEIGSRQLSFASTTSLASIRDAINSFTEVTGVTAAVSGTGVRLVSSELGSDQFVSVQVADDGGIAPANAGIYNLSSTDTNIANTTRLSTYADAINRVTDEGQDVQATINGIVAVGRGARASINTDFLATEVLLTTGAAGGGGGNAQTLGSVSAYTITGGGADFQLAPNVDIAGKVGIGVRNVAARSLGRTTDLADNVFFLADLAAGKALNAEDGDLVTAQKAIRQAIKDVSSLRGRLGSFQQNTIGATIRSLGVSFENTTAAESAIRDTDFAKESAELTRSQILVSAATSTLAIANSQPQSVLQLLG